MSERERPCWTTLPGELKEHIFEYVEDDANATAADFLNYRLVSQEWQEWFALRTYENLVVNSSRLSELDRYVGQNTQRQSAVKKITLRVQLKPRSDDTKRGPKLTAVLVGILECLSKWIREPHQRGLALEIITYDPEESNNGTTPNPTITAGTTPVPSPEVKLDYLEKALPTVPIVTSLILRQGYYKCLKYPMLAALIKSSFPNLNRLHMEGCSGRYNPQRSTLDNGDDITEFMAALPATLRSWTFVDTCFVDPSHPDETTRVNGDKMPLRHIAGNLEKLVFINTVDARNVLNSCVTSIGPGPSHLYWPRLRLLSLCTRDVHCGKAGETLCKATLLKAAQMVKRMPNIEAFELWYTCLANRFEWDGTVLKYATETIQPTRTTGTVKKARMAFSVAAPSGGQDKAEEIWQGEVRHAWETVADTHERELEVDCLVLGLRVRKSKNERGTLVGLEEFIDRDGSEVNKLVEKGEMGHAEVI
ncbi:hypothetical protein V8F20_007510 [Naviculisporaceae sp. PSN 640]